MFLAENHWYSRRTLPYLIFGGVFERHPRLRVVFTEQRADWVGSTLRHLDSVYESVYLTSLRRELPRRPSEYWSTNCYIGASFLARFEVDLRDEIGTDRLMWGADYPHYEGTWGYTAEHLRNTFAGIPEADVRRILGENALECYQLDAVALRRIADEIGPTPTEIDRPLQRLPDAPLGSSFRTLGAFS